MAISNRKLPVFLVYVLATQAIVCIAIILDVPFVRQVLGFLFLAFVPGFVLLKSFRFNKSSLTEAIIFSVGLSAAFLLLIGFLINELGSSITSKPLSFLSLVLTINIAVTLICILGYFTSKEDSSILRIRGSRFSIIVPFLFLPLLSVIGVMFVNAFGNNILIISVIVIISILFLSLIFRSSLSPYHALALFSIALAQFFCITLVSNYMYGYDVNLEFNVFAATKNASFWDRSSYDFLGQFTYNSMASITILPTIFSNLLNIDGSWVFKIVFPAIFSLMFVALYKLYQIHWSKKIALVSTIFFAANSGFFTLLTNTNKTMVGQFFYVLLFLFILKKNENNRGNWLIIIIFTFALAVSHYSMAYIYLFLILSTWLVGKTFLKKSYMKISSTIVMLSFCIIFLCYVYITPGPFYSAANAIRDVSSNLLSELFNLSSRGDYTIAALGLTQPPSFLHNVGRYIFLASEFFIMIGFVSLLAKWRKGELNSEYATLMCLNMGFLFSAILVPGFAGVLEVGRLYEISLLFLSPLFVLGGGALFGKVLNLTKGRNLLKKETYCLSLVSIILVAFFFFQTGLVYEISGDPVPSSISLSRQKMDDTFELIHESDVFAAIWLSKYGNTEHLRTYSDIISAYHVLTSYSTIDLGTVILLSNTTETSFPGVAPKILPDYSRYYVYMSQSSIKSGKVIVATRANTYVYLNSSEIPVLNSTVFLSTIYSNSASEIYYREAS